MLLAEEPLLPGVRVRDGERGDVCGCTPHLPLPHLCGTIQWSRGCVQHATKSGQYSNLIKFHT